eukprot:Hpha_TRINITY_DN10008_c0_g2::TRINITY_DN10008_c0_g2_i1::g.84012::m.84012
MYVDGSLILDSAVRNAFPQWMRPEGSNSPTAPTPQPSVFASEVLVPSAVPRDEEWTAVDASGAYLAVATFDPTLGAAVHLFNPLDPTGPVLRRSARECGTTSAERIVRLSISPRQTACSFGTDLSTVGAFSTALQGNTTQGSFQLQHKASAGSRLTGLCWGFQGIYSSDERGRIWSFNYLTASSCSGNLVIDCRDEVLQLSTSFSDISMPDDGRAILVAVTRTRCIVIDTRTGHPATVGKAYMYRDRPPSGACVSLGNPAGVVISATGQGLWMSEPPSGLAVGLEIVSDIPIKLTLGSVGPFGGGMVVSISRDALDPALRVVDLKVKTMVWEERFPHVVDFSFARAELFLLERQEGKQARVVRVHRSSVDHARMWAAIEAAEAKEAADAAPSATAKRTSAIAALAALVVAAVPSLDGHSPRRKVKASAQGFTQPSPRPPSDELRVLKMTVPVRSARIQPKPFRERRKNGSHVRVPFVRCEWCECCEVKPPRRGSVSSSGPPEAPQQRAMCRCCSEAMHPFPPDVERRRGHCNGCGLQFHGGEANERGILHCLGCNWSECCNCQHDRSEHVRRALDFTAELGRQREEVYERELRAATEYFATAAATVAGMAAVLSTFPSSARALLREEARAAAVAAAFVPVCLGGENFEALCAAGDVVEGVMLLVEEELMHRAYEEEDDYRDPRRVSHPIRGTSPASRFGQHKLDMGGVRRDPIPSPATSPHPSARRAAAQSLTGTSDIFQSPPKIAPPERCPECVELSLREIPEALAESVKSNAQGRCDGCKTPFLIRQAAALSIRICVPCSRSYCEECRRVLRPRAMVVPGRGRVVHPKGAVVTSEAQIEGHAQKVLGCVPKGTLVQVVQVIGNRGRLEHPVKGWVTLRVPAARGAPVGSGQPVVGVPRLSAAEATPEAAYIAALALTSVTSFVVCTRRMVYLQKNGDMPSLTEFSDALFLRHGVSEASAEFIYRMSLGPRLFRRQVAERQALMSEAGSVSVWEQQTRDPVSGEWCASGWLDPHRLYAQFGPQRCPDMLPNFGSVWYTSWMPAAWTKIEEEVEEGEEGEEEKGPERRERLWRREYRPHCFEQRCDDMDQRHHSEVDSALQTVLRDKVS